MVAQPLDSKPEDKMFTNFLAHQESRLFYWASKITLKEPPKVSGKVKISETFKPVISIANIIQIVQPCIGVPSCLGSSPPLSFLFLKPRKVWPKYLNCFMQVIVSKSKHKEKSPELIY